MCWAHPKKSRRSFTQIKIIWQSSIIRWSIIKRKRKDNRKDDQQITKLFWNSSRKMYWYYCLSVKQAIDAAFIIVLMLTT